MDFKEYQEKSKRTCPTLGNLQLDLAHMILGIGSEQEELIKAIVLKDSINELEEQIDKIWYISNYCTLRGFNLQELYNDRQEFEQENWETECGIFDIKFSKLQDCVKKYIAYNKPLNEYLEKDAIKGMLFEIDNEIELSSLSIFKGLENNVNKLLIRFPLDENFTKKKALNRNLEQERIELEK